MHDLVIRNGTIIDGTGGPRFRGDIAVNGDRITEVGGNIGPGAREVNAEGLVVTPGWVDMHTHYDAQATWDPYLTPSGWHGVTTVVMGNCGVGFAPCRPEDREWLIEVMEGVEDIPGAALTEGIKWDWTTFPEYLDALEKMPRAIDIATQVPHSAVRGYVMGPDSAETDTPNDSQIKQMYEIVKEALEAGALGFTTSRTPLHKSAMGNLVAGTHAEPEELLSIGAALSSVEHAVFGVAADHIKVPEQLDWMRQQARDSGRPLVFNLTQSWEGPDLWKQILPTLEEAHASGEQLFGQVAGRPIGIMMSWRTTAHPFIPYNEYAKTSVLDWKDQVELLKSSSIREAITTDTPFNLGDFANFVTQSFDKMYIFSDATDYEPSDDRSVASIAKATGQAPQKVAYDALMRNDGTGFLYFPLFNFANRSLDPLYQMHAHPFTRMGLSDGGAHCGAICDAGMPTFMLTHWTRDRTSGATFDLEYMVMRQTKQTAEMYGMFDRGVLAPGMKADINLIDYDNLKLEHPRLTHDLPAGGGRLVQRAIGYRMTVSSGKVIFENGKPTGELPGKLLRGVQRPPAQIAAK